MFEYTTANTCSTKIWFDIRDNQVHDVVFENGCNGNLKAMAHLVEGMETDELIKRLGGISCGDRGTSCGDQLARAVRKAVQNVQKKAPAAS